MTQRKSRSRVGSFYIDIEKDGFPDNDKQHKHFRQKLNNEKSNILTVLLCSFCLLGFFYIIYDYRSIWNNNFQLDQSILLSSTSNINSPEISILKDELLSTYEDVNKGGTGLSLSDEVQEELKHQHSPHIKVSSPSAHKIAQDGSLVSINTDDREQEEYKINEEDYDKNSIEIQHASDMEEDNDLERDPEIILKVKENLKEIFSVNPIIILSLNNQIDEFLTILLNMNISPEPKVINLSKHPNFSHILKYLKNVNGSDEENIPRLFLGGQPVGTSQEIIDMYKNNELISYLRSKGQGLINA